MGKYSQPRFPEQPKDRSENEELILETELEEMALPALDELAEDPSAAPQYVPQKKSRESLL